MHMSVSLLPPVTYAAFVPISPVDVACALAAASRGRALAGSLLLKKAAAISGCPVTIEDLARPGFAAPEEARILLTATGRAHVKRLFGALEDEPDKFERLALPARILGLDPTTETARKLMAVPGGQGLFAAILARGYALTRPGEHIQPGQIRAQLVWHGITRFAPRDFGECPPFQDDRLDALSRQILRRMAGLDKGGVDRATAILAAQIVGASGTTQDDVRAALARLSAKLAQRSSMGARSVSDPVPPRPTAPPALDQRALGAFVAEVQDILRTERTPPFDGKVAIAQVFEAWQRKHQSGLSLEAFKTRLVEAANRREIALARLDLPELFESSLRERSATRYMGRDVHLIVTMGG